MAAAPSAILDARNMISPLSVPAPNTALLLMDYINYIVATLGPPAAAATSTAARLRGWALSNGMSVFHCLLDSTRDPPPTSRVAERWPALKAAISQNPSHADETVELTPKGDDQRELILKRPPGQVSVLRSRGLAEALRERGIKSLILAGISTSGCVLSTAREAADAGFTVTVVKDACCDRSEEVHRLMVEHGFSTAHVVTGSELLQAWGRRATGS